LEVFIATNRAVTHLPQILGFAPQLASDLPEHAVINVIPGARKTGRGDLATIHNQAQGFMFRSRHIGEPEFLNEATTQVALGDGHEDIQ
jgi:hypothetical protein